MKDLLISIKKEISPFIKQTEFAAGITGIVIGISSQFSNSLGPKWTILIICIGAYLIIRKACAIIITKVIPSVIKGAPDKPKYPDSSRKTAKYLQYIFLILPILGLINFFYSPDKSNCHSPEQKIGVIISKFSPEEAFDGFSYKMTNLLRNDLIKSDTIGIVQEKNFLDISATTYIDTAGTLFDANCYTHGLLVFGCRIDEKLFDCSIYVKGLPHLQKSEIRNNKKNGEILYIENPSLINFSIEEQAQQIAEFVIALLEYNAQNYGQVSTHLNNIIRSNNNAGKFSSYCYLFMGNSYALMNNHEIAILYYGQGLEQDSTNAYLNYNAGISKLSLGDTVGAFATFQTAIKANPNLQIPKSFENWKGANLAQMPYDSFMVKNQNINLNKWIDTIDSAAYITRNLNPRIYPLWYPVIKKGSNNKYGIKGNGLRLLSREDTLPDYKYDSIKYTLIGNTLYCLVKQRDKYGIIGSWQEGPGGFCLWSWKGRITIPIEQPSEFEALNQLYEYRRKEKYLPKRKGY